MAADNPPALRVADGSTVEIATCDCFEDQITHEDQDFGTLDWERINPATGPIYVEGAEPGDLLVVHIKDIRVADRGVMTTGPNLGVFGDELSQNVIRMVPIVNGEAVFSERVRLPLRPMIGVIGTAPATDRVPCGTPGDHGGNMDCTRITTGARLILPVNVPGALFALGDLHAAMGDGEVAVCGIEIAGTVKVQLHVLKGRTWPAPMLVNDDTVMTIASAQLLDEAATLATKRMAHWLAQEFSLDLAEAALLLSATGQLRVCQVVDPLKTARMEMPRGVLEGLGFTFPY
ncbi:MAG: acetamidase/formamidase family protein [Alicyclobacillus herbarius]|uniref:acetamidase/formamidase family protein n=1 Tax=Alicyclobacillus herbarius TaxID=122960 RepID=UPI002356D2EC|nr:acetamidase/formamidase family protein [Alicyclobacillus herbarius]MCL6633753.1 acetamidase/formamidase family protein [Alicyclobacillus herbarius]